MATSPTNFRKLFADICRGYTRIDLDKSLSFFGPKHLYIKHLSHFDQVDIDLERDKYYKNAQSRKIPTLEEKIAWLDKEGLWTKKDESDLRAQKVYVENLEKTKGQVLAAQRREIEKTLSTAISKYNELFVRKNDLIGYTCEQYAEQRVQSKYLIQCLYKDEKLSIPLHKEKSFDTLDDEELDEFMKIYLNFITEFSHENLKKIAVSGFFTAYFYISEDYNHFFGKPICDLTFYQLNLLSYGVYFKNIFQNNKIPENISQDPEKIEEFIKKSEAMKKTLSKAGNKDDSRVGLVGASKEDLEIAGVKGDSRPNIFKKGPINDINDAVKAAGIK